ncbi:hypothetical protein [Parafilimonas terrae]|uniref:Predicted transcriptional regulator, contains an HTH and PUA-like domains n=1 Tax=Parafilimonas terrae TaxID=1465490 RepID=A0A1I5V4K9_9BACT|nr:hypothetical protein [Parafilimonas terrae]SFQ02504.1 Predicted transcriptional regulator, contains an HTH and PUA-like domains [Parafilimonas terrae]
MKVLLSIKPEFADKIFAGTKLFEFRRTIFKNKDVKKVVVYASSPIQKVIGEFEIDFIIKNSLNELWHQTQEFSGITQEYFFQYFSNKEEGFAIKIKNQKKYKQPKSLKEDYNLLPPQSFIYL